MVDLFLSMSPFLQVGIAAGGAGILVLLGTPLVEWAARRGGWVARPSGQRWHEETTPHVGGIAIVGGIAVAVALSGGHEAFAAPVWGGAALLFVAGLADDLWGLRPNAKLAAQLGATALVLSSGLLFWPSGPTWASGLFAGLWVLGLTNALNLLDAMDGVAAGVVALAAAALGGVAGLQGTLPLALVAAAVAVAAAGFLTYNFSPARLFMGDCGSLPLGFLLAALGLGVQGEEAVGTPGLIPVLVLAVPLFDTTFVSVTRMLRGQSVVEGGTDHTMHRLVRLGFSERQVALLFYGAGLLCGSVGLIGQVGPASLFHTLALAIGGAALGGGWRLAHRTEPDREDDPVPSGGATEEPERSPQLH